MGLLIDRVGSAGRCEWAVTRRAGGRHCWDAATAEGPARSADCSHTRAGGRCLGTDRYSRRRSASEVPHNHERRGPYGVPLIAGGGWDTAEGPLGVKQVRVPGQPAGRPKPSARCQVVR